MNKIGYLIIMFLFCMTTFAQQGFNSTKSQTVQTIENDLVNYKNGSDTNLVVNNQRVIRRSPNNNSPDNINYGTYLATEEFEASVPPTGWVSFSSGDPWEQTDLEYYNGSFSAVSNINYNEAAENWLITPLIDLTSATNPQLTYYEFVEQYDALDATRKYGYRQITLEAVIHLLLPGLL